MPLILHIGMQKTGTSSLQYFFHSNREQLARDNIIYPHVREIQEIDFNGVSYHNCLAGTLGDFPTAFPKISDEAMRSFRILMNRSTASILLSAEDFSRTLNLLSFREFFSGVETRVVIYLRDQVSWAQSMYNQRNKILFSRVASEIFASAILSPEDLFHFLQQERYAPLMHYDRLLQRWSAAFGRESMRVRVFAKEQILQGDLISDFMAAIGIDDLTAYKMPPRINENLANGWITLVRKLASTSGAEIAQSLIRDINTLASNNQITLNGPTDILPEQIRTKMRSDYSEGNRRVAREFFGRQELFP